MVSELVIKTINESGALVIELAGMLDGHTCPELNAFVQDDLITKAQHVIFELGHLSYISSAGMSIFIGIQQDKITHGGTVHLVNPSASVGEVFNLLGLHALFPIHANLNAALETIQPSD